MPHRSRSLAMFASLMIVLSTVFVAAIRPGVAHAAAPVATCAPDSGSAKIGGFVTDSGGTPVNGAVVTAYTSYGDRGGYGYTNASGVYQITGLIGGSYLLKFEPQSGGYLTKWSGNAISPQTATAVTVVEGGTVTGANAQIELGARFSGTVTGSGPLSGARVTVYDASGQSVAAAYTDASGIYTTSPGLPTGSYRVGFEDTSGFLSTFYAGKATLATADPLAVTAPNVRSGTNAALTRGGQISGKVTDANGTPLSSISVSAQGTVDSGYAYTDASGNYTINGLASGNYTVEAAPLAETTNLIGTPQSATVAAPAATNGVNFAMVAGGTLTGKVTDEGGMVLKDITVFIGNSDGSYQNYVYTNAAGVYSATALPTGMYKILFRPSAYIPEAYNNHPDFAQAESVAVTAPNTVSGIDAVLAKGGAIKGKVTDATTGLPVKDVFVEVLDANNQRVETANTQADGTYQTNTTLLSGSYNVRFNADERFASCAYVTEYYNRKPNAPTADRVVVSAPAAVANIDAALTRGSILFGKMTDAATGAPITSGQVTIFDAAGKRIMFGRLSFVGGWHSETALPSGSYRVLFGDYDTGYVDEYYNDKPSLATANVVTLNAPIDVTGLDAALAVGAAISGHVTAADTGLPFSDGSIAVFDADGTQVGYANIAADGTYRVATGLASGSYRVGVIPANYLEGAGAATRRVLTAAVPAPGYSASFYRGAGTASAATPVLLTAPTTTGNIDIAMLHSVSLPLTQR